MHILKSGHPDRQKLDRIRGKIAEVDSELSNIERAPISSAEAEQRLRYMLAGTFSSIGSAVPSLAQTEPYQIKDRLSGPLTLADLAVLIGEDTIVRALMDRVAPYGQGGLSASERDARTQANRKRRRELVADDERETVRLEDRGYVIDRPYFDAAIALPIWGTM